MSIQYGVGAIEALPALVAARGAQRVLLVSGRRSFEASGAARMLPELAEVAQIRQWREFAPNPELADLRAGMAVMDEFAPDLVLGVGGGSALDVAKLLCAYRGVPETELPAAIRAGRPSATVATSLALVPTTAGSGSEATHFAVVYIGQEKFSVAGQALRPSLVVLDPALSMSGSPYQRATSGLDAVAQAIESLWAVAATDHSRRYARHALGLLLPAIERFVNDSDQRCARAMAIGSHLAGRAIDVSRTTAAHALSYGITKGYGVSHGHAVGLTLGAFLAAHRAPDPQRLAPGVDPATHAEVMAEIETQLGADPPAAWRELMTRVGLEPSLGAAGVRSAAQRAALAESVNVERLGINPVTFTSPELTALLAALE